MRKEGRETGKGKRGKGEIYICVCTHIHMCTHKCIHMYVCIYVFIHVYTYR